jgi:hypothetical protein
LQNLIIEGEGATERENNQRELQQEQEVNNVS